MECNKVIKLAAFASCVTMAGPASSSVWKVCCCAHRLGMLIPEHTTYSSTIRPNAHQQLVPRIQWLTLQCPAKATTQQITMNLYLNNRHAAIIVSKQRISSMASMVSHLLLICTNESLSTKLLLLPSQDSFAQQVW
jgi:hypothetical protein